MRFKKLNTCSCAENRQDEVVLRMGFKERNRATTAER
jgi:hypothetical protein